MTPRELRDVMRRLHGLEQAEQARSALRRRLRRAAAIGGTAAIVALPAIAGAVEVPHAFEDGAVIEATAFNENFAALADALTTVETDVAALGPAISGSTNVDVTDNVISLTADVTLEGDLEVSGGHLQIPIPAPSTWNNAGGGAAAYYNNVTGDALCDDEADRARIRVFVLDESTSDGDSRDSLCFCSRYTNDTNGTSSYRWECFHGQNDGT